MSARRQEVIDLVFAALKDGNKTTELEPEIVNEFNEYVRIPQFAALPLPFLTKLVGSSRLKISPDDVCKLFADNIAYNGYNSIALLGSVNFRAVSTETLLRLRELTGPDDQTITLPIIVELIAVREAIAKSQECGGARIHDFDEKGLCKRCKCAKCIQKEGVPIADVHTYADDGRCSVCGAPRCHFDNLHVFNYDGHCHICGKAQPTRCEIVGCQAAGGKDVCAICGKPIVKP
jgi:hypothetical protein